MYLIPIPASADNDLGLLHDGKRALVVDPGDAKPVLRALQLKSILVTHRCTGAMKAQRNATNARAYGLASLHAPETAG